MIHTAERPRTSPVQIGLVVLAAMALLLSLFSLAQPARATEGDTVWLHQDLGDGVSSQNPGDFYGDCDKIADGQVIFHFVANKLAEGTTSGELTATFSDHSDVTVDGYFPGEGDATMHFDVVLDASATLTGASATFNTAQTDMTMLVLSGVCDKTGGEEGTGTVEVEKYFCPTDGDTRTEFDVFGPAEPTLKAQSQEANGCSVGAGITFTIWQDDQQVGDPWTTDENGVIEEQLPAGDYTIREESSGATQDFTVAEGQVTAIVVTNYEHTVQQGTLVVNKWFCEGDTASTDFYTTQPDTTGCTMGDADFTLDGNAFSTTDGTYSVDLDPGTYTLAEVSSGASTDVTINEGETTTVWVVNTTVREVQNGTLEVEKYFCPTDGETRTEFDVFGPADATAKVQGEGEMDGCSVGADVTFTIWQNDEQVGDALTTDENGNITIDLAPGDYTIREEASGATADFTVGEGQVTAIVVVNYVHQAQQGQIKVLKYFCDSTEDSVEFYLPGEAPNLENCDPGDAEFTLDGGEAMSTDGGILLISADEGTHTLAEVGTDASVEVNVTEGEITPVIVLNNVAAQEEQGSLVINKWFCEGDSASVDFYMEGDEMPDLSSCAMGDAMFTIDDGEAFSTVDGTATVNLDAGSYTLAEVDSGASADVDVMAGETTTVTVVNTTVAEVPQGQIKVLKYQCQADASGVEFYLAGEAPNLENCDKYDAEFTLDGGDAWSTTDGIAIVWADEGTHTLAEVGTDASVDLDVTAGEITTVVVLNNVESEAAGGGEQNQGNQGGGTSPEQGVQGGQGGPGQLPDTSVTARPDAAPLGLLALLAVLGLGGFGALNLQAVRRRSR